MRILVLSNDQAQQLGELRALVREHGKDSVIVRDKVQSLGREVQFAFEAIQIEPVKMLRVLNLAPA